MADMADVRAPTGVTPAERYTFAPFQLELYGIKELQVLEDLLRRSHEPGQDEVLKAVAEQIKTKISWPREDWDVQTWPFLTAFYKAQRARLEHRMLFGERRESKDFAGGDGRDG